MRQNQHNQQPRCANDQVRELFEAEGCRLLAYLQRRTGSHDVAQDLFSTVFECALRRQSLNDGAEISTPWLYTVAKRRTIDHWRTQNRQEALTRRCEPLHSDYTFEDDLSSRMAVGDVLLGMCAQYQYVLEQKYFVGLPVAEIASTLGVSQQAAESTLARARRQLRTLVAAETVTAA